MDYKDAIGLCKRGKYAAANELILKALENQVPVVKKVRKTKDEFRFNSILCDCGAISFEPDSADKFYCQYCGQQCFQTR